MSCLLYIVLSIVRCPVFVYCLIGYTLSCLLNIVVSVVYRPVCCLLSYRFCTLSHLFRLFYCLYVVLPVVLEAAVPPMPDAWRYRVTDRTGWLGVSDHLVGLVVKASASTAEDPGFESRLRRDLSALSHTSDLKIGSQVATLPGAWHYTVSAETGWPVVSIL